MQKRIQWKIKGMQRDLSVSAFNPEYAYENMNIRITPINDNTMLSVTNEQGNKLVSVEGIEGGLKGTPIGQIESNGNLVIFTAKNNNEIEQEIEVNQEVTQEIDRNTYDSTLLDTIWNDHIYKLKYDKDLLKASNLFIGDLNFDVNNPIEATSYFESEKINKVYWVDGKNPFRFINTELLDSDIITNSNMVSASPDIGILPTVEISKAESSGKFASGVIQYAITYFSNNSQESNIFYTSPLYYITFNDRAGSPEEVISNSFKIKITNLNSNAFTHVKIYSILRSTKDTEPLVKVVGEYEINNDKVEIVDTGNTGYTITPTDLLYIGGEEIIASTLNQKDNTLFLGNIKYSGNIIPDDIKEKFKKFTVSFRYKKLYNTTFNNLEDFEFQIKDKSSYDVKIFKYLEYYRFGIQLQLSNGKWSEPIFIGDFQNNYAIKNEIINGIEDTIWVSEPYLSIDFNDEDNRELYESLLRLGVNSIRPIIVYPEIYDRTVLCQGVLNPTVYNVKDRYENAPFAQASWFFRPDKIYSDIASSGIIQDIDKANSSIQNRHNEALYSNCFSGAELQSTYHATHGGDDRFGENQVPYTASVGSNTSQQTYVEDYIDEFFVDKSIVTLHSPDLEDIYNNNLDLSAYKLRIIGLVPISSHKSDIRLTTDKEVYGWKETARKGFHTPPSMSKYNYGGNDGGLILSAGSFYNSISSKFSSMDDYASYVIYPFHNVGSIENSNLNVENYADYQTRIKSKCLYNYRFSHVTHYLNLNSGNRDNIEYELNDFKIFKSDKVVNSKLNNAIDNRTRVINYFGNIEKVITTNNNKKFTIIFNAESAGSSNESMEYTGGYPLMKGRDYTWSQYRNNLKFFEPLFHGAYDWKPDNFPSLNSNYPIEMEYKSNTHGVLVFKNNYILPYLSLPDLLLDNKDTQIGDKLEDDRELPFWADFNDYTIEGSDDTKKYNFDRYVNNQNSIKTDDFIDVEDGSISDSILENYWYLWIGELHKDYNSNTMFGGTESETILNNQWVPCGNSVSLINHDINTYFDITWEEGDTYYQRYDHLKTYPKSFEERNGIVEILSFMCETRKNLEGFYNERAKSEYFTATPDNFTKLNDVYSQGNNFFTYRITDPNNIINYNNIITWTKTKTPGEKIDTWTNITLASTLDFDGNKGPVTALKKLNNQLVAFQEKGISQILFNENVQISSTEGVPIEIANSGKVQGKRYISDHIGCRNKWSICETPAGIYFIDDYNKSINLFNGKLGSLSDNLGFRSWINNNSSLDIWNPESFGNFVTHYDSNTKDVYFINKDNCLAFSELIGQFTSFYNYENTPYIVNISGHSLALDKKCNIWEQRCGNYNTFFNQFKPFYTTVIANPEPTKDKVYNTLEFRSDSWDKEGNLLKTTFDTLDVWNEYQEGTTNLNTEINKPSNLKQKFRIWRANIPRDKSNGRDRIRNPWAYLKLSMDKENTNKTILHDIVLNYFD